MFDKKFQRKLSKENTEDFYIVNEKINNPKIYSPQIENIQEFDNRNIIYSTPNKFSQIFFKSNDPINMVTLVPKKILYEEPEKIYSYTKHRIPGYDYEELDIFSDNNERKCDEKSIWTHCLCQFTCAEPNSIDCYTPCESGCECKEDFVFDKRTQQCILPSQCEMPVDYFYDFET